MRHVAHVAPCVTFPWVRFRPEIIYFIRVLVSSILSGHSLNIFYFSGFFWDFSKNPVFGVHSMPVASNFVKSDCLIIQQNSTG